MVANMIPVFLNKYTSEARKIFDTRGKNFKERDWGNEGTQAALAVIVRKIWIEEIWPISERPMELSKTSLGKVYQIAFQLLNSLDPIVSDINYEEPDMLYVFTIASVCKAVDDLLVNIEMRR